MIRPVVTFDEEVMKSDQSNEDDCYEGHRELGTESRSIECEVNEQDFKSDNSTELSEDEELRRSKISKALKGKVPWNKGRKHSPETLRRIKERTWLAMQDPKVKMKLVNKGHPQSDETRMKIRATMRLAWEKRQRKLMLQETCCYEWQNLLAEGSRKGLLGEEELQWDSYEILTEKLERELQQSIQQREKMAKLNGSKNAPKSAEQRRKISEAIAAKWADPEYRSRVYTGIAKYHGIPEGVERKRKKRPSSNGQTRTRSSPKTKADVNGRARHKPESQTQPVMLKRSRVPEYRDPLASSKLEMLKNIRAQRAAIDNKKVEEALTRAKLLIAEAEKASKALEIAATKSAVARASLNESKELIAEAIRYIESMDRGDAYSFENGTEHSLAPTEPTNANDVTNIEIEAVEESGQRKSNRDHLLPPNGDVIRKFNGKPSHLFSNLSDYGSLGRKKEFEITSSSDAPSLAVNSGLKKLDNTAEQKPKPNGLASQRKSNPPPGKPTGVPKKWVRGRLVDAVEEG